MGITVTLAAVLCICSVAICQIIRNHDRTSSEDERKGKYPAMLLTTGAVMLTGLLYPSETWVDTGVPDMLPAVICLWIMSSSMTDYIHTRLWTLSLLCLEGLILVYRSFSCFALLPVPGKPVLLIYISLMLAVLLLLLIYGFTVRLKDVKSVMKNGTIWTMVCITVDVVYVLSAVVASAFWQVGMEPLGTIVMGGMLVALGMRIMTDSVFVLWRKQERVIVESMKVTSVTSATDESRIDDVYKDLYERIVCYFEAEKPYLNHNLTINEIVRELYSNKLYVSRAISQFTGRNFCQYVNYHRVMYSVESFRSNPEYKVHELASISGFNSTVSYNMAFRLFMGENPSEWCRKEKSAIVKKKK